MDKDEKLEKLLTETETVVNYLKENVNNGTIKGALYVKQIIRFVEAYEDYKETIMKGKRK